MTTNRIVPPEIVKSGIDARLDYFDSRVIKHHYMEETRKAVLAAIKHLPRGWIVVGYGQSGVGKSAVRRAVMRAIVEDHFDQLVSDRSRLPFIANELYAAQIQMTWSEIYHGFLYAADEPLADYKLLPRSEEVPLYVPRSDRISAYRFGYAYCKLLEHRRPYVVLVDNANFLNKIRTHKPEWILEPLMDLAKRARHVLLGTYTIRSLLNLTSQVARRTMPIYFPRYHRDNEKDQDWFAEAVEQFADVIPVEKRPDLMDRWEMLMEGTLGCVGLLHDWLYRALSEAILQGSKTITVEHLEATRFSAPALARMKTEAAEGEELLGKATLSDDLATDRLRDIERVLDGPVNDAEESPEKPRKVRKRKPGKRNAKRDPIGNPFERGKATKGEAAAA